MSQRYESVSQAAERTGDNCRSLRRRVAVGRSVHGIGRPILRVEPEDIDAHLRPSPGSTGARRKCCSASCEGRYVNRAPYTRGMPVDRVELHQLVDELPDDQVSSLLVEARRRAHRRQGSSWPPAFFGFGPASDGRTDTSERVDEILAEGFGRD